MKFTTVKKLYRGEFQYNIVLRFSFSYMFQGINKGNYTELLHVIMDSDLKYLTTDEKEAMKFIPDLYNCVMNMENFTTRYSWPRVIFYTNNYSDIQNIAALVPDKNIISIGIPPDGLEKGMVYMPATPFDYRVTIRKICKLNQEFVEWARGNKNIKLQQNTEYMLEHGAEFYSSSGSQLYVKGDRNLFFVQFHLGNTNLTVDRILN